MKRASLTAHPPVIPVGDSQFVFGTFFGSFGLATMASSGACRAVLEGWCSELSKVLGSDYLVGPDMSAEEGTLGRRGSLLATPARSLCLETNLSHPCPRLASVSRKSIRRRLAATYSNTYIKINCAGTNTSRTNFG